MRRAPVSLALVALVVLGAPLPALALPGASPAPVAAGAATAACTVSDPGMTELSGLATTAGGYIAMNDSNLDAAAMKVFTLDQSCRRVAAWSYPGYPNRPLDPEDLAVTVDGTVWIADTGNVSPVEGRVANPLRPERVRIALWRFRSGTAAAPPFRFTYPDGPHDCEALLLAGDGSPIFVAKQATGPAGIYVPTRALDPSGTPVPLRKAGTFRPRATGTANPLGAFGVNAVTGGAMAPDGAHVALRTYADAYEWAVSGGDVVRAITTGEPTVIPLPNEPMGEAIAYTRDGGSFVTIADQEGPAKILKYARPVPPKPTAAAAKETTKGTGLLSSLKPSDITNIVIALGVIGALMVVGGVLGIRLGRKRRAAQVSDSVDTAPAGRARVGGAGRAEYAEPDGSGYDPYGDYDGYGEYASGGYAAPPPESTGSRRRGSTYSTGPVEPQGRPPASDGGAGRVYGAGEYGGSTYGPVGRGSASTSGPPDGRTSRTYGSGKRDAGPGRAGSHADDGDDDGYGPGAHAGGGGTYRPGGERTGSHGTGGRAGRRSAEDYGPGGRDGERYGADRDQGPRPTGSRGAARVYRAGVSRDPYERWDGPEPGDDGDEVPPRRSRGDRR